MNKEIEELQRQKKEIEEKIRALKGQDVGVDGARIHLEHYSTNKPDTWSVRVETMNVNTGDWFEYGRKKRAITIINSFNRDDAIEAIPKMINRLQKLYDKLKTGE